MIWYAIASLTPAALLALGSLWGGAWTLLAIASITGFVFVADRWITRTLRVDDTRSGLVLSYVQAITHLCLWISGLWMIGSNQDLTSVDKALLIVGYGLYFGQTSNSNAHELIHKKSRFPRRLGILLYGSVLFAHHASAHMRVHHIYAATPQDPNTARRGEGFWSYLPRAWWQGWWAGKRAEDTARRHADKPGWTHPYLGYALLSLGALALAAALAGLIGVMALLAIAAYAQVQLYLSDYVQHYGLERARAPSGKFVPIGPQHSWNAPHWYSSAMMLNAPRHSDHHLHPGRAFPALRLDETMPTLPHSLPVMAVLALFPPIWRRVMDKRVSRWRQSDHAAPTTAPASAA